MNKNYCEGITFASWRHIHSVLLLRDKIKIALLGDGFQELCCAVLVLKHQAWSIYVSPITLSWHQRKPKTKAGKNETSNKVTWLRGHSTISLLKSRFLLLHFSIGLRRFIWSSRSSIIWSRDRWSSVSNFFLQFLCFENFKRVYLETTFLRSVRTISQKVFNRLLSNFLRLF